MGKTALLSVYDKTGIVDFARELNARGYRILSSGGTFKTLSESGITNLQEVAEYTGTPEMPGGLVKTLNPKIHAGILADRNNIAHMEYLEKIGAETIDIVACNLYPFEEIAKKIPKSKHKDSVHPDITSNIDIGGPTMIRAAAKNCQYVYVAASPDDYQHILAGLDNESDPKELMNNLSAKAFALTSFYDSLISNYKNYEKFPSIKTIPMKKVENAEIRYGENPHQEAALYINSSDECKSAAMNSKQLQGKKLSYNNYLDLDAAWRFIQEYADDMDKPMCNIVKHNNTCGAAIGKTLVDAYQKSFACDRPSAFGGIMSFNKFVDADTAYAIVKENKHFVECIIAPGYTDEALRIFEKKADLRILEQALPYVMPSGLAYKGIDGGILAQDRNAVLYSGLETVSETFPSYEQLGALIFAMRACKHTKSNAIILARGTQVVGVGTGQQSRIDSLEIATRRMEKMNPDDMDESAPLVMASDAFFPFPDCVEYFAKHGGGAVIWPGGSKNDDDSIKMANEHQIAMVMSKIRHFTH